LWALRYRRRSVERVRVRVAGRSGVSGRLVEGYDVRPTITVTTSMFGPHSGAMGATLVAFAAHETRPLTSGPFATTPKTPSPSRPRPSRWDSTAFSPSITSGRWAHRDVPHSRPFPSWRPSRRASFALRRPPRRSRRTGRDVQAGRTVLHAGGAGAGARYRRSRDRGQTFRSRTSGLRTRAPFRGRTAPTSRRRHRRALATHERVVRRGIALNESIGPRARCRDQSLGCRAGGGARTLARGPVSWAGRSVTTSCDAGRIRKGRRDVGRRGGTTETR